MELGVRSLRPRGLSGLADGHEYERKPNEEGDH